MADDRSRTGFLVAALGAAVLAVSVFLPWYGVDITASGAAAVEQRIATLAQEYGNSNLQTQLQQWEWNHGSLVGYQIGTLSAHRYLQYTSMILFVIAGIALVGALFRLADMQGLLFATGNQLAVVGGLAALLIVSRMILRPAGSQTFVSLSLKSGIWVSLLSAAAIVVGGRMAGSPKPRVIAPPPKPRPILPPVNRDVASPLTMFRERP